MKRGAWALALACAACGSLEHPPDAAPRPLADIPIELRHGLPTMDVVVGGETLKLFLDLGGYQPISLTASEMERAKVTMLPRVTHFRNSEGQAFEARQFLAGKVRIAGFELGDLEGGEALHGKSGPPDGNGDIGRPVVDHYLLVLDYPQKHIRLYASGDDAAMRAECGSRRFRIDAVDGVVRSIVETEFGPRVFLWDTGATHNMVRPAVLPREAVAAARKIDDGPPVAELQHLALNGHDVGMQPFRLIEFSAPMVDGYLGAGILSSHKVCLDIPRNVGAIS